MNKDVSITFAFDVLSPYSFLAYQTLTRYEKVWGLKLNYLPVSIPALFQLAQNKPPGDTCTHKRKYLINDLAYSAEYSKTSFKLPSKFPVDTGLSLTALNLIKVRLPQLFDVSLKAIWEGYFIHDRDISKPLIIQELLQEANVDKVDEILKDSSQEKFQVEILKNTESILSKGAFGLPFFITEGSDGEERCFFGSDRLRIMAHQLKLPYEGPVPGYEIKESSVGGSITFAFDVLSAYSYFAHQLLKRQNWRVKVDYRPVSLTKIMKLTGNIGPTFGSENKKRYTLGDLSHLSKLYDIPYKPPSKFPFNTALVQTLLAIIKERDQDGFIPALDLLWVILLGVVDLVLGGNFCSVLRNQ